MFHVFWCIHPEFGDMRMVIPVIVKVEVWKNGVCVVAVETPISIGSAAVWDAPNDWGGGLPFPLCNCIPGKG